MLNKPEGADAPSASVDAMPSIAELRDRLKETRELLDALQAERTSLSLRAVLGDREAIKRVQEVDKDRAEFVSMVETIEQAIMHIKKTDPYQEKRERQMAGFERSFERNKANLHRAASNDILRLCSDIERMTGLQERLRWWSDVVDDPNYNPDRVQSTTEVIERIKRKCAADICYVQDVDLVVEPIRFSEGFDKEAAIAMRDAAVAMRDEMVDRLCAAVTIDAPTKLNELYLELSRAFKAMKERDVFAEKYGRFPGPGFRSREG